MIQMDLAGRRLTADEIKDLLEDQRVAAETKRYIENLRYFKGDNPYIMDREPPDYNSPNNKVPIPYARKIINTVAGYMYKPGLITYASENEQYKTIIDEIFAYNEEPIETAQLGVQTSIQGVGYELHYVEADSEGDVQRVVPRFTKIPAEQMIPVWDYSIEPVLAAVLRHYNIGKVEHIHVYYADAEEHYIREEDKDGVSLIGEIPHYYGEVPVVVYRNNEEMIGDFEPVKGLLNSYDVLASDSMNEFDRFAWAYLLLKGFSLTDEDVEALKWKRVFENLDVEDAVSFLTKDINHAFIQFMAEWIRKEIHKQSHVPDFLDQTSGDAVSGVAISKLLYDFEFIAATKEAYFKAGLMDRFALIDKIIGVRDGSTVGTKDDIEINMARNKPYDAKADAETFQLYSGNISKKTLIENFAPFVPDAEEELDALRGEEEAQAQVDLDMFEKRAEATPQKAPFEE